MSRINSISCLISALLLGIMLMFTSTVATAQDADQTRNGLSLELAVGYQNDFLSFGDGVDAHVTIDYSLCDYFRLGLDLGGAWAISGNSGVYSVAIVPTFQTSYNIFRFSAGVGIGYSQRVLSVSPDPMAADEALNPTIRKHGLIVDPKLAVDAFITDNFYLGADAHLPIEIQFVGSSSQPGYYSTVGTMYSVALNAHIGYQF